MSYITRSHISEQQFASEEKMEFQSDALPNEKPQNVNTICYEKDSRVLRNNTNFSVPMMSLMADYDFSPSGEILAVHYDLVYHVPTRRAMP